MLPPGPGRVRAVPVRAHWAGVREVERLCAVPVDGCRGFSSAAKGVGVRIGR